MSLEIACTHAPALRTRTHTRTQWSHQCMCGVQAALRASHHHHHQLQGRQPRPWGGRSQEALPAWVDGGLVPTALTTHATSTPHPQGRVLSVRAHANKKLVQKAEYIWSDGQEGMPNKGLLFNELRSKTKTFDADQGMDASKWVRGTSAASASLLGQPSAVIPPSAHSLTPGLNLLPLPSPPQLPGLELRRQLHGPSRGQQLGLHHQVGCRAVLVHAALTPDDGPCPPWPPVCHLRALHSHSQLTRPSPTPWLPSQARARPERPHPRRPPRAGHVRGLLP